MTTNETPRYGDEIEEFFASVGRPVTMSEVQDATGISRQGAYGWRDRNQHRLRQVGKGRNGAKAYVLVEESAARVGGLAAVGHLRQVDADMGTDGSAGSGNGNALVLMPGMRLLVRAVQLTDDGEMVADLESETGEHLRVVL